jgi:hypothetical protein
MLHIIRSVFFEITDAKSSHTEHKDFREGKTSIKLSDYRGGQKSEARAALSRKADNLWLFKKSIIIETLLKINLKRIGHTMLYAISQVRRIT